jgi:cardiolipin synthase
MLGLLIALTAKVRAMLENDFARARRVTAADLRSRSFAFRFAVRAARLSAPVQ